MTEHEEIPKSRPEFFTKRQRS